MENRLFIGRKYYLDRLWRDVFGLPAHEYGAGYSLIGPNNIGKSTLISQLAARFEANPHPNVYYIPFSLKKAKSVWDFWVKLVRMLAREIPEQKLYDAPNADPYYIDDILAAYEFFRDPENMERMDSLSFDVDATEHLDLLFQDYRELGIRLIITIDEFDLAKELCKDGILFSRLFLLSHKSDEPCGHSVILISRRSISNIEHHMEKGSTLTSAYPSILLNGFDNEELETYFESFAEFPCGMPDEICRQDILHYCGRNPGLLMLMRHEYGLLKSGTQPDIHVLYRLQRVNFEDAYTRMCKLMKEEYIDSELTVPCFEIFLEAFIGPVSSEADIFRRGLEGLENHGFTTKNAGGSDIFALAGWDSEQEEDGSVNEPLSPYFIQFVIDKYLPAESENLSNLLVRTEIMLRDAINEVGIWLYQSRWDSVVDQMLPSVNQEQRQRFYERLRKSATENNANARGISYSLLNVLNFMDYLTVCKKNWSHMGGFFREFKTSMALSDAIDILYEGRNQHSHKNFKILDRQHCAELRSVCGKMVSGIEETLREFRSNLALQSPEISGAAVWQEISEQVTESTDTEIADIEQMKLYIGQLVQMKGQRVGAKGNLVGEVELEGHTWRISLPRENFTFRNEAALSYVDKTLEVKITRWDPNRAGPHFVGCFQDAEQMRAQYQEQNELLEPEEILVGQRAIMQPGIVKPNGNLTGIVVIDDTEYKVSIARSVFAALGLAASSFKDEPFWVKLTRWDRNPSNPHFNAEPEV